MRLSGSIIELLLFVCSASSCSIPDSDAEKVKLDPDGVSFMETLMSRESGQGGVQNGFSPTSTEGDPSGALSGDAAGSRKDEKTPTPPEETCPVGLSKAVLLYPPDAQSLTFSPVYDAAF